MNDLTPNILANALSTWMDNMLKNSPDYVLCKHLLHAQTLHKAYAFYPSISLLCWPEYFLPFITHICDRYWGVHYSIIWYSIWPPGRSAKHAWSLDVCTTLWWDSIDGILPWKCVYRSFHWHPCQIFSRLHSLIHNGKSVSQQSLTPDEKFTHQNSFGAQLIWLSVSPSIFLHCIQSANNNNAK